MNQAAPRVCINSDHGNPFKVHAGREILYLPEKCIGCAICTMICPKDNMVIGSVGAVARGLINKNFLQKSKGGCTICSMCSFDPTQIMNLCITIIGQDIVSSHNYQHDLKGSAKAKAYYV